MVIVGITGAIGHGKTSLAEALVKAVPSSVHLEAYELIAEVIEAWHKKLDKVPSAGDYEGLNNWLKTLPPIVKQKCHTDVSFKSLQIKPEAIARDPLSYQKLFQHLDALSSRPQLLTTTITEANKAEFRPILQWVGGYLVAKVSPAIWWDEMTHRAQEAGKQGAKLVVLGGIRYPGDAKVVHKAGGKIIKIQRANMSESDLNDPTERERHKIKADAVVVNNGGLEDLMACSSHISEDIANDNLKKQYLCVVK